jgi:transcriptional regulator with XRE-family HTH domain
VAYASVGRRKLIGVEQSLGAIVRTAMQQRGLNIKQLARLTADLDDPVSEGTIHNVIKGRVAHPRYDTIRPLCAALDLDYNALLAELHRPAHQVRDLPDDFHYLTDEQWRCLIEVAKQFRIANEGRQRSTDPEQAQTSGEAKRPTR